MFAANIQMWDLGHGPNSVAEREPIASLDFEFDVTILMVQPADDALGVYVFLIHPEHGGLVLAFRTLTFQQYLCPSPQDRDLLHTCV